MRTKTQPYRKILYFSFYEIFISKYICINIILLAKEAFFKKRYMSRNNWNYCDIEHTIVDSIDIAAFPIDSDL